MKLGLVTRLILVLVSTYHIGNALHWKGAFYEEGCYRNNNDLACIELNHQNNRISDAALGFSLDLLGVSFDNNNLDIIKKNVLLASKTILNFKK